MNINTFFKKYGFYLLIAALLIAAYFYMSKKKATTPAAKTAADDAAAKQVIAWVSANSPSEYGWWVTDLNLYNPGGAKATKQFLGEPDLPDGKYTKTRRVISALNELRFPDGIADANAAYAFTSSVYSDLISQII